MLFRQLILIRHTKSSWKDYSLPDFDRPLKKDRIPDAKNMAKKLHTLHLKPDLILCSPAKRTRQTAEYFCNELGYDFNRVRFDQRLYESSAEEIREVVSETPDEIKTLIVVGHNPSLTHFANMFNGISVPDFPTTGVAWLELDADDWNIRSVTPCKLKWFLTPKTI